MELNQRPIGYEPTALTPELQALCFYNLYILFYKRIMAEKMGFEPTEPKRIHSLSRGAHSTTLAPFQNKKMAERQGFEPWVPQAIRRFSRPLPSTTQPSFLLIFTYIFNELQLLKKTYKKFSIIIWLPRLDSNQ